MKIQINTSESYEINFPEKITALDFTCLVERLNNISKLVNKSHIEEAAVSDSKPKVVKIKNNRGVYPFKENRAEAVIGLRLMYFGTREEKNTFATTLKAAWPNVANNLFLCIKKFNILPEEIGLIRFPRQGESRQINALKIIV